MTTATRPAGVSLAVLGGLAGAALTLAAWGLELAARDLAWSPAALWTLHASQPLVWLTDLAPLVLGLLGQQVDRLRRAEAARQAAEHALRASAERQRALTQEVERLLQVNASVTGAMSEGLVLEGPDGRMQLVNPTLLRLLDYSGEELIGQHWSRIVAEASQARVAEESAQRPGGVASSYEARLVAKDGYEVPVLVSATPLVRDGQYAGTLAVLVNIAERLKTEAALQRTNDYLAHSLDELQRRAEEMQRLNEMGDKLQTCLSVDEARAAMAQILPRLFPTLSGAVFLADATRARFDLACAWGPSPMPGPGFSADECLALRRGRSVFTSPATVDLACPHLAAPAEGATLCMPMTAPDNSVGLLLLQYTEARSAPAEPHARLAQTVADSLALALANLQLRETLRQQSIRDVLTGMYNRRYMEESLEREIRRAARRGYSVGVIMLDLDHFKQFNDAFGHAAGDALLQTVGAFLRVHIRAGDIACRYGGEEFILLLPEASLEITRQRAEHLRAEIHHLQPEYRGQRLGPVTASAGVAAYPLHGQTVEAVVRAADEALYQAKRQGRDQIALAAEIAQP